MSLHDNAAIDFSVCLFGLSLLVPIGSQWSPVGSVRQAHYQGNAQPATRHSWVRYKLSNAV